MCVCLHVNKVYQINGSIVGRSKEDKNFGFTYIRRAFNKFPDFFCTDI